MPIDADSLSIRIYPDPVLRRRAEDVRAVDDDVRTVANRMIELMQEADGIGLAATQVGLPWRIFVAHVSPSGELGRSIDDEPMTATLEPMVYINPSLSDFEGDLKSYEEGCLSLPEIAGEVRRHPIVTIEATGLDGETFRQRGRGLLARCWQHEYDHLDGVLIIDRMTQMSRLKNRSRVKSLEKQAGAL